MATKAEQFGCTSEREASCEHWTPPERAGIGGAPTDPKGSGRCELEKRMVRRMTSCPKTGKAFDNRTKVEKFGCLDKHSKCMEYEAHPSSDKLGGFCRVGGMGKGKVVNALPHCPRTEALARLGCEDGETRCRHYLTNVKVRGQIRSCSRAGKNIYELEECPEKKTEAGQTLMKRASCCVATGLDGDTCDIACCYYVVNGGSPFCELVDKERMMEDDIHGRRRASDILNPGAGAPSDLREVPEVEPGIQRQDGEVLDAEKADADQPGVPAAGGGGLRVQGVEFFIPGNFKAKGRPRAFADGAGNIREYPEKESMSYEMIVRSYAEMAMTGQQRFHDDAVLFACIDFIFPRPKAKPYDVYQIGRPDVDNCLKTILDALNGIVYKDDARIVKPLVQKLFEHPSLYGGRIGVNVKIWAPAKGIEYERPAKVIKSRKKVA